MEPAPPRLNAFGRVMRQWERLAPYNAAQVMVVAGDITPSVASNAWERAVQSLGLAQIGQAAEAPVQSIEPDASSTPQQVLDRAITVGLNTSAPSNRPLMPLLLRAGDRTHLALVYRHLWADSTSIRLVMRQWFGHLTDDPRVAAKPVSLDREASSLLGTALRHPLRFVREVLTEMRRMRLVKSVARVAPQANPASPIVFERREMPAGIVDGLVRAAKSRQVKVNDLFVAAGAIATRELLPMEHNKRRPIVGFGTIVDTRLRDPLEAFGVSLGFQLTFLEPGAIIDVEKAIRVAAEQSTIAKANDEARRSLLRLSAAELWGRRLKPEGLATFYRKRCPLAGGVSNVNLNRDWPGQVDRSVLLDYTRVSPLGPMLHVVFTPTTLGNAMHFGFTWRRGLLNESSADGIAKRFLELLMRIAE